MCCEVSHDITPVRSTFDWNIRPRVNQFPPQQYQISVGRMTFCYMVVQLFNLRVIFFYLEVHTKVSCVAINHFTVVLNGSASGY